MSAVIRALAVLVLWHAAAFADGTARVLLADADPELQRAVQAVLAPWRLEVVIDAAAPADPAHAQLIGDERTARYVVWRAGGDLVVFDRERGAVEHRAAPAGPLDPASAAAAALTVKTLMRLPPPPPDEDRVADASPPPADEALATGEVTPAGDGVELRVQGGAAARAAQRELGGRASLAVFVKPARFPLRLGVAGEVGTGADVQSSGFKGAWRDWSVVGLATWGIGIATRWELEPYVGAGVLRSMLDGEEPMMTPRHERATLVTVRAGAVVRVRTGAMSFGGMLGFDATLGTPTYSRMGNGTQIFDVPAATLSVGLVLAVDLGR